MIASSVFLYQTKVHYEQQQNTKYRGYTVRSSSTVGQGVVVRYRESGIEGDGIELISEPAKEKTITRSGYIILNATGGGCTPYRHLVFCEKFFYL